MLSSARGSFEMKIRNGWAVLATCGWLLGCGTNNGSEPEPPGKSVAKLETPPQISPDLPLDQDQVPERNPNAMPVSVAASASAGYLLAYPLPYAPEYWSRQSGGFYTNELALMHWDAVSGAATLLTKLPAFSDAKVIDVGSAWLVVYQAGSARYSVTVARDGTVSAATAIPGTCGFKGFVRAANTALLTDACGNGVLLDLNGQPLKTMAIATSDAFFFDCDFPTGLVGGQVAFNGIDYLVLYSCFSGAVSKSVLGFQVSPTGDLGAHLGVILQPAVPYKSVAPRSIAGDSAGNLLAVLAEGKSSGPETAITYVQIFEAADHSFSIEPERLPPGESIVNDGQSSARGATALTHGGALVIVRERSNGDLDLITPSPTETGADTTQPLLSALPDAPAALVSSDDPFAGGQRLLIAADARAVRFDTSAQAIDVPPAVLFSARRGQFEPSLAFDGQTFLAAWTEAARSVPGWSGSKNGPQIFGHRLSASGALLGATSFGINPTTEIGLAPLVAARPGLFSSAWNGWGSPLAGAATITSADPALITPYPSQPQAIDFGITSDGAHTAVAWSSSAAVKIAQLASAGSWSTALTVAPNADPQASAPALAFNAGQYAVLWTSAGDPGQAILYGARVSGAMALLDATPKELLRFARPERPGVEAVAAGDHFVVAWFALVGSTEELRIARLSSTLQLLDPAESSSERNRTRTSARRLTG